MFLRLIGLKKDREDWEKLGCSFDVTKTTGKCVVVDCFFLMFGNFLVYLSGKFTNIYAIFKTFWKDEIQRTCGCGFCECSIANTGRFH